MKKFWVYNEARRDASGPFEIADLKKVPGFGSDTMVAPDGAVSVDAWRKANTYSELQALFITPPPLPKPPIPSPPSPSRLEALPRPLPQARPESLGSNPSLASSTPTTTPAMQATRHSPQLPSDKALTSRRFIGPIFVVGVIVAVAVVIWPACRALFTELQTRAGQPASPKLVPAASTPVPQNGPSRADAATDPWAGRTEEAVSLTKSFPVRKTIYPRCPRSLDTVADVVPEQGLAKSFEEVSTWPKVHTVPEAISCKRFMPVAMLLLLTTAMQKKTGTFPSVAEISRQVRDNPDAFRKYEISVAQAWSAIHGDGPNYIVEVEVHEAGLKAAGPVDHRVTWKWQVNLSEKTVRPLNMGAWTSMDSSAAGEWLEAEVRRDRNSTVSQAKSDELEIIDVSAIAPAYGPTLPTTDRVSGARRRRPLRRISTGKPDRALLPGMGAPPKKAPESTEATVAVLQSKNCPGLMKLMASSNAIMAQYGAEKTAQVLAAAEAKFQEYRCSEWVERNPDTAASFAR